MPTKKKRANQPDEQDQMDVEQNPDSSSDSSDEEEDDDDGMPEACEGNEVSCVVVWKMFNL